MSVFVFSYSLEGIAVLSTARAELSIRKFSLVFGSAVLSTTISLLSTNDSLDSSVIS